jgi:hypothetical protein
MDKAPSGDENVEFIIKKPVQENNQTIEKTK